MRPLYVSLPLVLVLVACGGSSSQPAETSGDGVDGSAPPPAAAGDAGAGDAGGDPSASTNDGTPNRVTCTSSFGSGLTADHGRLDGYLVAIVPAGQHGCNADSSHLHLQISMKGSTYDVAVNLDTLEADLDAALPGGAWSEGWHDGTRLDYPTNLGLHAAAFTATSPDAQRTRITAALATANHVSIFATGYDATGAHDVHRQGGGRDGAIVIDPLSAKAHVLAFRFTTDSF
jgi:hypothetical protein